MHEPDYRRQLTVDGIGISMLPPVVVVRRELARGQLIKLLTTPESRFITSRSHIKYGLTKAILRWLQVSLTRWWRGAAELCLNRVGNF